jgi:class 3 adenylate cyclase
MPNYIIKFVTILLDILRWVFIILVFLTLFGIVTRYVTNLNEYPHFLYLINIEKVIYKTVKDYIPTKIMHYDGTRVITIVVLLTLIEFIASLSNKLKFYLDKRRMMNELNKMKKTLPPSQDKTKLALLENKMQGAVFSAGKDRRELLKQFAQIKTELEKVGRDLAFLSIDVVDSTKMKIGEDPVTVENDFLEYHQFVEGKLKEHGLIKASWTPDGVMACFNTVSEAVLAAQSIINNLEYFNKNIKGMKNEFKIRCGVNAGHVYYDESIPLEQFSDRTIDIAGHMQKYAPVNTILVAKNLIVPVKSDVKFTETKIIVDGFDVCQWTNDNDNDNDIKN